MKRPSKNGLSNAGPLLKKVDEEGRHILWLDESAFYLIPFVGRTYAPIGQTPVLHSPCSYDHLSAISAISEDGHLYFDLQTSGYTSGDVVEFLKICVAKSEDRY